MNELNCCDVYLCVRCVSLGLFWTLCFSFAFEVTIQETGCSIMRAHKRQVQVQNRLCGRPVHVVQTRAVLELTAHARMPRGMRFIYRGPQKETCIRHALIR